MCLPSQAATPSGAWRCAALKAINVHHHDIGSTFILVSDLTDTSGYSPYNLNLDLTLGQVLQPRTQVHGSEVGLMAV